MDTTMSNDNNSTNQPNELEEYISELIKYIILDELKLYKKNILTKFLNGVKAKDKDTYDDCITLYNNANRNTKISNISMYELLTINSLREKNKNNSDLYGLITKNSITEAQNDILKVISKSIQDEIENKNRTIEIFGQALTDFINSFKPEIIVQKLIRKFKPDIYRYYLNTITDKIKNLVEINIELVLTQKIGQVLYRINETQRFVPNDDSTKFIDDINSAYRFEIQLRLNSTKFKNQSDIYITDLQNKFHSVIQEINKNCTILNKLLKLCKLSNDNPNDSKYITYTIEDKMPSLQLPFYKYRYINIKVDKWKLMDRFNFLIKEDSALEELVLRNQILEEKDEEKTKISAPRFRFPPDGSPILQSGLPPSPSFSPPSPPSLSQSPSPPSLSQSPSPSSPPSPSS